MTPSQVVSYGYDYQLDRLGLPSLFDYVGYNFCFVGYWTGPFYDYNTYSKMVCQHGFIFYILRNLQLHLNFISDVPFQRNKHKCLRCHIIWVILIKTDPK